MLQNICMINLKPKLYFSHPHDIIFIIRRVHGSPHTYKSAYKSAMRKKNKSHNNCTAHVSNSAIHSRVYFESWGHNCVQDASRCGNLSIPRPWGIGLTQDEDHPAYRTNRTLKLPSAMFRPCFSAPASPKPTVRTDRERVNKRPSTNRTAHTENLLTYTKGFIWSNFLANTELCWYSFVI